jgi:hypothetical protein
VDDSTLVLVAIAAVLGGLALGFALHALTYGRRYRWPDRQPRLIQHTPSGTIELHHSVTEDDVARWLAVQGALGVPRAGTSVADSDRPGH